MSTAPGSYDLRLYRGDSYAWRFVLWADDERTEPVDLAGATAAAQIRPRPDAPEEVDLLCTILEPNTVDVYLTADQWDADPFELEVPPQGAWDLELTFPGGNVRTVVAGQVLVTKDVTRAVLV
jgi:hypothetical protein